LLQSGYGFERFDWLNDGPRRRIFRGASDEVAGRTVLQPAQHEFRRKIRRSLQSWTSASDGILDNLQAISRKCTNCAQPRCERIAVSGRSQPDGARRRLPPPVAHVAFRMVTADVDVFNKPADSV
jgi:hypothetical protein